MTRLIINTFFWFFFFMVGFVSSLRIVEDLGPAFTERWLRRRISSGVLVAIYVLIVLLCLKVLRLYGTTASETANSIRIGIFIYMAFRLQNHRAFRWLLLGLYLIIWPYFVMKWSVVAINAVMLLPLLLVNQYRAWILSSWSRAVPLLVIISAVYWRWHAWLYTYTVAESLVLAAVTISVLLLVGAYDRLLSYWLTQLKTLRYDTQHDALTGVRSLSKFNTDFGRYRKLAAEGAVMSIYLVMLDIDHFKQINDTYGHLTGNAVLQAFCTDLGTYLEEESAYPAELYRTGGEEFSILITGGATPADAVNLLNGYLEHLRQLVIHTEAADIRLTISVGLTQIGPQDLNDETPISRVDTHLYAAKRAGRNQLVSDCGISGSCD